MIGAIAAAGMAGTGWPRIGSSVSDRPFLLPGVVNIAVPVALVGPNRGRIRVGRRQARPNRPPFGHQTTRLHHMPRPTAPPAGR